MSTSRSRPTAGPARSRLWLATAVGLVVAVVAVVALVAVLSTGGDGDDDVATPAASDDTSSGGATNGSVTAGITVPAGFTAPGETHEVTVIGEPLAALPRKGDDPAVGEQAPVLQGHGFAGEPIEIASSDGEPVMVVVVAHWCPHCNAEIPRLVDWNESGRVPEDLRVIGVSTAARDGADHYPPSEWIVDEQWPWDVMTDSGEQTAAAALGVSGYPFIAIIGGDGSVLARHTGELGSADEIDAFVREALGT